VNLFAQLIETQEDALLQRWVSGALQDQLPGLLRSLIVALRRGSPLGLVLADSPPRREGLDVQGLIREYHQLGSVLLELAEASGTVLSMTDMRVFTDFMATAVAQGVAAHARFHADTDRTDEAAPPRHDPQRADARRDREAIALERLQDLFMKAPVIICVLEGPRQIVSFANAACRAWVAGRELVGRPFLDALPELRGQGLDTLLAGVMASGEPYVGNEVPLQSINAPAGEPRYLNFVYQPRRNPEGVVHSVLVVGTDVTAQVQARKRVEAESGEVRQSEERLRRLLEVTGGGTWELDIPAQRLTADSLLRAIHNFPPDGEFDLEASIAIVHPADRQMIRTALEAAFDPKGSQRYHTEYRTTDAPGEQRWIEARGRVYFDPTGAPLRLLGTAVDVTARKEAELAREGLLAALEAQPFLQVCVLEGPRHVVKLVNLEYRTSVAGGRDVVGMPVLDAFPGAAGQGFDTLMNRVLETGEPFIGREVPTRLDPGTGILEERFFNFVIQPVRGPHGTVDALLNISHDVTHFVEARRVLEGIAAQNKERVDFERQLIGIVSHDLRSPLASISMAVQLVLLHPEGLKPASLKGVLLIKSSLEGMIRLVSDLLDFTQVRLGTGLPIVRAPMDLHTVVRQVVEDLRMTFPDREIELEAVGNGHGVWDSDRLGQAALNLITNALKYGPPGAAIQVSTRGDDERIALEVHNPGEPIDPDTLSRLFEPMQRGRHANASGRSVGLGLFIVKHIVEALGGTIAVASSAGAGTTFTMWFPRGDVDSEHAI
jgi:sigma-B regulation protein RsbU (phosphoserine phosphatase)